ncbi:MAG: hypothetical protein AAF570_27750, partial [Bacteroidota bacterium]
SMYREDYEKFFELLELVEKRLMALRSAGAPSRIDVRSWMWYLGYLAQSVRRLQRNITIEEFEREIDDIEWDELEEDFIYKVSGISGFVYLNETEKSKWGKSRFWLQRAIHGVDMAGGLGFYINLADFYLSDPTADNAKRIEDHIKKLEDQANSVVDPNLARLYRSAVLELQARALIFNYGSYDDDHIKVEENLRSVRAIEKKMDYDGKNSPAFVRAFLKMVFSEYYLGLIGADLDKEDIEDLLAMAMDDVNEAMSMARRMKDSALKNHLRLRWLAVASELKSKASEKELKEIYNDFRKSNNFPAYVAAARYFARFQNRQENLRKAYELLVDMMRRGYRRVDEGGLYLVTEALASINDIFNIETKRPGVSWLVDELDPF